VDCQRATLIHGRPAPVPFLSGSSIDARRGRRRLTRGGAAIPVGGTNRASEFCGSISDVSVVPRRRPAAAAVLELTGCACPDVVVCSRRVMAGSSFPSSDAIRRTGYRRGFGCGQSRCTEPGRAGEGVISRERWCVCVCPKLSALAAGRASEQDLDRWKEIF
jgi:hypothetical protein